MLLECWSGAAGAPLGCCSGAGDAVLVKLAWRRFGAGLVLVMRCSSAASRASNTRPARVTCA
eukprot:11163007-Lingulodinium_polyedra.AAC.1